MPNGESRRLELLRGRWWKTHERGRFELLAAQVMQIEMTRIRIFDKAFLEKHYYRRTLPAIKIAIKNIDQQYRPGAPGLVKSINQTLAPWAKHKYQRDFKKFKKQLNRPPFPFAYEKGMELFFQYKRNTPSALKNVREVAIIFRIYTKPLPYPKHMNECDGWFFGYRRNNLLTLKISTRGM